MSQKSENSYFKFHCGPVKIVIDVFQSPFLKNPTVFAAFRVLGMRTSVMHLVYSVANYFAMVSSPDFNVSMLAGYYPRMGRWKVIF